MKSIFTILSVLWALGAAPQEAYPSKSVRLIAAAAPGGNPDVLARMLAAKLSDAFGKPFVVENIPGAGGVVAAEQVARTGIAAPPTPPRRGRAGFGARVLRAPGPSC